MVAKRRRLRLPHVQPPPPSRWLHRHPERPQRRPALLVLQQVGSQADDHPVNSCFKLGSWGIKPVWNNSPLRTDYPQVRPIFNRNPYYKLDPID